MKHEIDVTDDEFDEKVIKQSKSKPVVVDFWAPWCGPCRMLGPVLGKVAEDYKGKFLLAKVNVEENQKISEKYDIMSIPAVKLIKDGKIVDEFVGAMPESAITEWIDNHLK